MTNVTLATAHRLRWLPNALTVSRAITAIVVFVVALQGRWPVAFWLFAAALLTDFLDGLAAKKLQAKSSLGEELDGLADATLGIAGLLSLTFTGHVSWQTAVILLVIAAVIGSDRVFRNQPQWAWRTLVAVAALFVAWTGIMWFYAYLAFGWSWLYVPATLAVLLACASLKRHRIRAWLNH